VTLLHLAACLCVFTDLQDCQPGFGWTNANNKDCSRCPLGTHSTGGSLASAECVPCSGNTSTPATGSTSADSCTGTWCACFQGISQFYPLLFTLTVRVHPQHRHSVVQPSSRLPGVVASDWHESKCVLCCVLFWLQCARQALGSSAKAAVCSAVPRPTVMAQQPALLAPRASTLPLVRPGANVSIEVRSAVAEYMCCLH
jgi:hypothetical protein